MIQKWLAAIAVVLGALGTQAEAQQQDLRVMTVSRPPFSMQIGDLETGFSLDLFALIAEDLNWSYTVDRVDKFGDMLAEVRDGKADAAIANISITAVREEVMDFSQPIFESGLQIMIQSDARQNASLMRLVFSRELLGAVVIAFGLLFGGGMLMWWFERRAQPYFDRPAKEAVFPAFWWALNLVVNGGFEERVPRTTMGRIFGVFLVISSLFLVSIFVARITAVMTVEAIQSSIDSIGDLQGKEVATIDGSTSATFLQTRGIPYLGYDGLDGLTKAFEDGSIDAVVFDAPVLAYYVLNSKGRAQMTGPVFQSENYGIALTQGSALAEPINQSLLRLRENGDYERIYRKWFGVRPGN